MSRMSVGDEPAECPLCMEVLEIDDINFFPCTCGYQICRFCWHRIRTDENGLCPACRKQYPENPAEFKPLTDDELQNIKKERKQKESQRKQKAAENRKHLANVRVVQKNLVFVVGLSPRLADAEVLKKHEYFGKYGKIHKVVINQSTSYAGSQGPSASAYVTYVHCTDALRAIMHVNNVHVDGRTLKTSLGTTKYCSHFLRSSQCNKPDCMYLHELGEEAASFTKEEMQMGKHQEYEQRLMDQFQNQHIASMGSTNNHISNNKNSQSSKKSSSPSVIQQQQLLQNCQQHSPPLSEASLGLTGRPARLSGSGEPSQAGMGLDAWPSLQTGPCQTMGSASGSKSDLLSNGSRSSSNNSLNNRTNTPPATNGCSKVAGNGRHLSISENNQLSCEKAGSDADSSSDSPLSHNRGVFISDGKPQSLALGSNSLSSGSGGTSNLQHTPTDDLISRNSQGSSLCSLGLPPLNSQQSVFSLGISRHLASLQQPNSLSFFSNNILGPRPAIPTPQQTQHTEHFPTTELPDSIPVSSSEDWSSAFGFKHNEDDLGFDPCTESIKGLGDLLEKENGRHWGGSHSVNHHQHSFTSHMPPSLHGSGPSQHSVPPGFSLSHLQHHHQPQPHQQLHQQYCPPDLSGSRMMDFMAFNSRPRYPQSMHNFQHAAAPDMAPHPHHHSPLSHSQPLCNSSQNDVFSVQGMREQLRSMLPNVNILFHPSPQENQTRSQQPLGPPPGVLHPQSAGGLSSPPESSWLHSDPAIVSTNIRQPVEDAPHWMRSIHQLTESDGPSQTSRLPYPPHFPMGPTNGWPAQMHNPPPGFRNSMRPSNGPAEPHKLAEALQ